MAQPGGSSGAPQQTLKLSDLAEGVARGAYAGLKNALDVLPSAPQTQRSKTLLKYIHAQKQKFLRLRILVQWANQALAVNVCAKAWGVASSHSDAFRFAADHVAYLHDELLHLAVPAFDVHTAWEILTKGQYTRLPAIIDEICPPKPLSELERGRALNKLNFRILCQLEGIQLPNGMRLVSVRDGVATLCSEAEYTAELTLVQAPPHLIQGIKNYNRTGEKQESQSLDSGDAPKDAESIGLLNRHQDEARFLEEGQWWWRLMNLKLLSASSKGPPLHPEHLEVLKQEIDIRMCMLQEATTINTLNMWQETPTGTSGKNIAVQSSEDVKDKIKKNGILLNISEESKERNIKTKKNYNPLTLVHEMVREISTRLLLSTVRKELCELVGKNCVWEKKLKLAVATHLKPGYRLYYWMDTPLVTESMVRGESSESHGPYLEIGANESGRVVMEHFPPLPSAGDPALCGESLDLVSLDVKVMLLKAAAANSGLIMSVLYDSLKNLAANPNTGKGVTFQCWKEILNAGGCSSSSRSEETYHQFSSSEEIGSPSIALYSQNKLILKVHCHLLDGSLILEAGNSVNPHLTPQAAVKLSVEEDRVNQSWKQWSRDVPKETDTNPTILAFDKVAARLWLLVEQLFHLVQWDIGFDLAHTAKKFSQQWSPFMMEPLLLEEYVKQNPNCSIGVGRHIQMPVHSFSLPKSFPQLEESECMDAPKGTSLSSIPGTPGSKPIKDLSCYLNMNLDADKDSDSLSMIIVGVDAWGIPVKIVNCLHVPKHDTLAHKEETHSPCMDRHDEIPVSGKIKPRKRIEKRKMSFEDSENDVLRMKRPCRTFSVDSQRENGSLLEDLHLSCMLDSDEDVFMTETNRASPGLRENGTYLPPQEPPDPDSITVQWCQRRLLWEHIVFQMMALDVPFLEEYEPGRSDAYCARLVGWKQVEINPKQVGVSMPSGPPKQEAFKSDLCFGFKDLQSVHIQVALDSDIGKWAVRIKSGALAHAYRSGLKCRFKGVRLRVEDDSIELEYSALYGATVAHALQDLVQLAHAQEFVVLLRKTVRDSSSTFENSLAWHWPGSCNIQVDELGLSHLSFRVDHYGNMCDKYMHTNPRNGSNSSDLDTSVIYTVEFLHHSCLKELRQKHLNIFGGDSREIVPDDYVVGNRSVQKVACHMTSSPSFPADFLKELSLMIEAGEPGLFLDAIATVSGSLLTIGRALSPSNFQAAKISPGLLSLAPSDPPYCFKLLFAKGEKNVAMDVRLFSNGISYFGIHQPRIGGGESPQGLSSLQNNGSDGGDEVSSVTLDMVQVLQRFAERVKDVPGVQVSHRHPGDGFRGSKLAGFGLWCQQGVMPKILKEYIACVAHG